MGVWNAKTRALLIPYLSLIAIISVLIVIIFSKAINADIIIQQSQQPSFDAFFKNRPQTACSCSLMGEELYVINTADNIQSFHIEFVFSDFKAVRDFILEPGSEKILKFNLTLPCNNKHITYKAIINNYYTTRVLANTVNIEKCQNLEISLTQNKFSIKPCETIMLNASIENINNFQEYYKLSLEKPEAWATSFKDRILSLNPFSVYSFNFSITPNCDFYGNKTIVLEANALLNKLQADMPITIHVKRYYPFNVSVKYFDVCNEFLYEFPISIENNAGFDNEFLLSLKPTTAMFSRLKDTKLVVKANSSMDTALFINPQSLKPGNYSITLKVLAKRGLLETIIKKNFEVWDCVNLQSDFDKIPEKLCVGDDFKFSIWNNAIKHINIVLTPNGFHFKSLENKTNQSNKLYVTVSKDKVWLEGVVDGIVNSLSLHIKSDELPIDKVFYKPVTILSRYDCYKPTTTIKSVRKNFKGLSYISIKNEGFKPVSYNVSLLSASWVKLKSNTITLQPSKTYKLGLYINTPNNTGSYPITLTFSTIKNGILLTYQNDMLLRVVGPPWYYISANWVVHEFKKPCVLVALILIIAIIIVLAFLLKASKGPEKAGRNLWITLISVALLLFVFLITFLVVAYFTGLMNALQPAHPKLVGLNITLPESKNFDINLSKYFYDPDLDVLRFDAHPGQGLVVTINDSIANIKPVNGFRGKTSVVFVAVDTKGATAKSPEFNVNVVQKQNPLYVISINYCWYIDLLLFALLLVTILLLISEITREPLYKPVFVKHKPMHKPRKR